MQPQTCAAPDTRESAPNNPPHARTQTDLLAGLEPAPRQDPQGGAHQGGEEAALDEWTAQEAAASFIEMAARIVQEGLDLQAKGRAVVGLAQVQRGRALLGMAGALLEEQALVQPWARVRRMEERLCRDIQLVRLGADGFAVRPLDLSVSVGPCEAAKMWRGRVRGWML